MARTDPTDASRARRGHEAPRGQEVTTRAPESEAALREHGGMEQVGHTPDSDRGKDGPQGPADKARPEEAKGKVSAQEAATFARSLAEHAADAPAPPDAAPTVEAQPVQQQQEPQMMGPEEDQELDMRDVKRNEALRKGPKEMGGSPEVVDPEAGEPGSRPEVGGGVRAVRPAVRAGLLDLATLMAEAQEAGILAGYQIVCVHKEVQRLNHRDFDRLRRLLPDLPSRLHQATLLKALAAHRHLDDLEGFAGRAAVLSVDDLCQPQRDAVAPPCPGGFEALGALRRHYDPISCLEGFEEPAIQAADAPPLPRWLRGLPREPVELAAVALHQAISDDLHTEEETRDGASAALSKVWRPHGATHPGLERWLLRLAAQAETGEGLHVALRLLLTTRDEVTREPGS